MKPTDVLYITTLKPCPGTEKALSILGNWGNPDNIIVQDIASLTSEGIAIPEWLTGTPTLVDMETRCITQGTAAIQRLPVICERSIEQDAL